MGDDWQSTLNHAAPRETGRSRVLDACAQAILTHLQRDKSLPPGAHAPGGKHY